LPLLRVESKTAASLKMDRERSRLIRACAVPWKARQVHASLVSLVSILIATILVLRNVSANLDIKEVERERANLARFFCSRGFRSSIMASGPSRPSSKNA
jgi:hypothetical protein